MSEEKKLFQTLDDLLGDFVFPSEEEIRSDTKSARVSESLKNYFANPDNREVHRNIQVETWSNPDLLEKHSFLMKEIQNQEHVNEKRSQSLKNVWSDENVKINWTQKLQESWQDPEKRQNRLDAFHTEEFRDIRSELSKEMWDQPGFKDKRKKEMAEYWADPANREKVSGPKVQGVNSKATKGITVGIHIETGDRIEMIGAAAIKAAGFNPGMISECINGNRKSHKGYRWHREPIVKDSE